MKFQILHALITDKNESLMKFLCDCYGMEEHEYFIYRFITKFTQLDLKYLEEIYKDDKENVKGMIEDVYCMLTFTDHLDYKQYVCDFEEEEEDEE